MTRAFHQVDRVSVLSSCRRVLLGRGVVRDVAQEVLRLGAKRVLVVTDAGVAKAGLVERVAQPLAAAGLECRVFAEVVPEPPARIIDRCASLVREWGADLVLGLGGGSSLDAAKAAAALGTNPGMVLDYVGMDTLPRAGLPKILIPTTAGTGSEATRVFVVTDETDNTKKVVYSDHLLPDVALLDPDLTLSMPRGVTADTGMDALVHAIESYVSVNATPFTEILALQAIELIAHNLPVAYAKGNAVGARYNLLLAANLAGTAFTSGGLGAVHGLSYVLGTEYHMGHGQSNAVMLPHVMAYNRMGCPEKYARVAAAMGEPIDGLSSMAAAERAVVAVERLLESLGISSRLSAHGVARADLDKLVAGGMAQARLFVPNPRDLAEVDVRRIYEGAL